MLFNGEKLTKKVKKRVGYVLQGILPSVAMRQIHVVCVQFCVHCQSCCKADVFTYMHLYRLQMRSCTRRSQSLKRCILRPCCGCRQT